MSSLREVERDSIYRFVASHEFEGRVLDYGCGKQPYRHLVERTAEYHGYDRPNFPGSVVVDPVGLELMRHRDEVLCTQVIQYDPYPESFLAWLRSYHRTLVLTYPTCWPATDPGALWHFTLEGMERLCGNAGWVIDRHELRATVGEFPLGYGLVAHAA